MPRYLPPTLDELIPGTQLTFEKGHYAGATVEIVKASLQTIEWKLLRGGPARVEKRRSDPVGYLIVNTIVTRRAQKPAMRPIPAVLSHTRPEVLPHLQPLVTRAPPEPAPEPEPAPAPVAAPEPAPEEITVKYRRKNLTRLLREMKERGITIEAIEANIKHKGVGATEAELNWGQPQLTRVRRHFDTLPKTRSDALAYSRSAALGNGSPLPKGFDLFGHWKPPVSTQRAPASPEPEPEPEPEDDDTGELGEALMQALREAATQHEPEPLPGVLTPWNNTVAPAPTTDRRAAALALIGDETLNEILKEHLAKVCDELEALSVRRGELEDEKATTELALEAFE